MAHDLPAARSRRAAAVPAGHPQVTTALLGAEVLDVGADDLGDPGPDEQQPGDQRRGARPVRAWRRVGRVNDS